MPRRNIQFIQGSYYHIYNRGAVRQSIFREDRNYAYVLRLMKQVAAECELAIIAYCLLPNHYHWLVRQDGTTPAGMLPKRVFGSYSSDSTKGYLNLPGRLCPTSGKLDSGFQSTQASLPEGSSGKSPLAIV